MSIFALPSLLAILMKTFFAVHFWKNIQADRVLVALFFSLLLLNSIELASFFLIEQSSEYVWLMRLYYVACVVSAVSLLIFCSNLSGISNKLLNNSFIFVGICVALACSTPGWVIDNVTNIGITTTRVPGPLFAAHPSFISVSLLLSTGILLHGYRMHKNGLERRRCLLILIAILPIVLPMLLVMYLMALGFYVNAVTVLSSGIVVFMLCIAAYTERDKVFRLLALVPFTKEQTIAAKSKALSRYLERCAFDEQQGSKLFQEARAEMEACLVEVSLWAADDNRSLAARRLGISRATLVRKARSTGGQI